MAAVNDVRKGIFGRNHDLEAGRVPSFGSSEGEVVIGTIPNIDVVETDKLAHVHFPSLLVSPTAADHGLGAGFKPASSREGGAA
jgi:hypothetical protein